MLIMAEAGAGAGGAACSAALGALAAAAGAAAALAAGAGAAPAGVGLNPGIWLKSSSETSDAMNCRLGAEATLGTDARGIVSSPCPSMSALSTDAECRGAGGGRPGSGI